jgi:hypothetical protein
MATLTITSEDREAAQQYANDNGWGRLVATGWEQDGPYHVPWFHFSNGGKRLTAYALPDGVDKWRRVYH